MHPVHPKGDQSWIFTGRTDTEAEIPIHWPSDAKNWLIWKDPDAGKDWRQEEKGMTEDEMIGWHHWLDGHEFGWTLEVSNGQGGLVCCSPWGCKELDKTEWLNWTEPTQVRPCIKLQWLFLNKVRFDVLRLSTETYLWMGRGGSGHNSNPNKESYGKCMFITTNC